MTKLLLLCCLAVCMLATLSEANPEETTKEATNKNDPTTESGVLRYIGRSLLDHAAGVEGDNSHTSRRLTHRRPSRSRKRSGRHTPRAPRRSYVPWRPYGGYGGYGRYGRYRRHYYPPRRPNMKSASITELKGVLRVVVIGDGEQCFVKIFQEGMGYNEQFGDSSTSTQGFIDLYGAGECEEGATGRAEGCVQAGVMAEAYRCGYTCETKVVTYVVAQNKDTDPDDGVNAIVNGTAGAEALAVCE